MNILHLEDNDLDAELIAESLRKEFVPCHITRVETRKAFMEAMELNNWDIILADYSLPSFDGNSALKLATAKHRWVPFIFVTGTLGEELAVETLRSGATDYILKHRLNRLPQAVARARRECESAAARRVAEQKIKVSLREKELLLQEVHHRVNNNFQIICSLLSIQADAVENAPQASAVRQSLKRIQSMAWAHAMLYASSSLQDIDFSAYAHRLANDISSSRNIVPADRIQLVLRLEPVRLEIDRAIPCGLILNELLSNAFRYAFPDGRRGEVAVSLSRQDDDVLLVVEDTGVGLPDSCHPTDVKSAGLSIVNVLTHQLRASMEITAGRGSRFALRFT